jgi:hypothetical protein
MKQNSGGSCSAVFAAVLAVTLWITYVVVYSLSIKYGIEFQNAEVSLPLLFLYQTFLMSNQCSANLALWLVLFGVLGHNAIVLVSKYIRT